MCHLAIRTRVGRLQESPSHVAIVLAEVLFEERNEIRVVVDETPVRYNPASHHALFCRSDQDEELDNCVHLVMTNPTWDPAEGTDAEEAAMDRAILPVTSDCVQVFINDLSRTDFISPCD